VNDNLTIVVVYEVARNIACCVEISDYFKERREALREINKFVRMRIPVSNVFGSSGF